jgi:hypothetical protein
MVVVRRWRGRWFRGLFPRWAKHFPIDEGIEFGQEVVDLVNLIELFFVIEEAELSFVFAHGR